MSWRGRGIEMSGEVATAIRSAADVPVADQMGYVLTPEVFQANGAGSFRAGAPSLAASDDNGSNQYVVEAIQCHGSNVGPTGTLRRGNGNEAGGGPMVAFYHTAGGQGLAAGDLSPSLKSDNTGGGAVAIAFHLTQDPISGDVSPAIGKGNAQGCATVGVAERKSATDLVVRRLTPVECMRLMGLPTDIKQTVVIRLCSDQQKSDVLAEASCPRWRSNAAHALTTLDAIRPSATAPSAADVSLPRLPLDARRAAVLAETSFGADGLRLSEWPSGRPLFAGSAASPVTSLPPRQGEDFVHAIARISSTVARITATGRADSTRGRRNSISLPNGCVAVVLSEGEINSPAADAVASGNRASGGSRSITSEVGESFQNCDSILTTSCISAVRAITGSGLLPTSIGSSFDLILTILSDWLDVEPPLSDSAKYRMVGNSGSVPTVYKIAARIRELDAETYDGEPPMTTAATQPTLFDRKTRLRQLLADAEARSADRVRAARLLADAPDGASARLLYAGLGEAITREEAADALLDPAMPHANGAALPEPLPPDEEDVVPLLGVPAASAEPPTPPKKKRQRKPKGAAAPVADATSEAPLPEPADAPLAVSQPDRADAPPHRVCRICGVKEGSRNFADPTLCAACDGFEPLGRHVLLGDCRLTLWSHPDGRAVARAAPGELGTWHDEEDPADDGTTDVPTVAEFLAAVAPLCGSGGPLEIDDCSLLEDRTLVISLGPAPAKPVGDGTLFGDTTKAPSAAEVKA